MSFLCFWDTYDKKVGIDKCKTKWMLTPPTVREEIMIHLKKFIPNNRNKQYRPNPLTYLNQRKWEDELITELKEEVYIPTPTHELVDVQPTLQDHTGVREHARKQLERFYATGEINDLGNVIYDYLNKRGILRLSEQDKQEVRDTITKDAERRRTRFEEPYKGSIETDVKKELLRLYITANRVEL